MPTKPVEFHGEASAEYDAAFEWYLERSPETALDFDTEVDRALADTPHRWAVGPFSTRRYLLRRFPYILIYRERASGEIQVEREQKKSASTIMAPMRFLRPSSICLVIGLGLFVAGFFLPAVRFPPDPRPEGRWGPGAVSHEFSGWECAEVTLVGAANFFRMPRAEAIPVALSGWINPLLLFYLLACTVKRLNRMRPLIAAAIVVCCVAMWIELWTEHATLLPGHYLWIAGILLILSAPLANRLGISQRNQEIPT